MTAQIAIVGAGQAAGWAARTLRQCGYEGQLWMIGEEPHPPYERPPLSKDLLIGSTVPEETHLFDAADWNALNVNFIKGTRAVQIARQNRTVLLSSADRVPFGKVLIATGSRPNEIRVPGSGLSGIYYLRTVSHSLAIAKHLRTRGAPLLIVGAGWIGLEVAAAARKFGQDVIVVESSSQICSRAVDLSFGEYIASVHRAHGVDLRFNTSVVSFEGDRRVEATQLSDGSRIKISGVVVGIGAVPNVELAAQAGLAIENGISVDEFGRTSDPDIFAAGDVASYPDSIMGCRLRPESWEHAQNHGIHTAKSMIGKAVAPYAQVPWFWSDQYDINFQIVGSLTNWDRTILRGNKANGSFCICYSKDGLLRGAAGANCGRDIRLLRRLIHARRVVDLESLANGSCRLEGLL